MAPLVFCPADCTCFASPSCTDQSYNLLCFVMLFAGLLGVFQGEGESLRQSTPGDINTTSLHRHLLPQARVTAPGLAWT